MRPQHALDPRRRGQTEREQHLLAPRVAASGARARRGDAGGDPWGQQVLLTLGLAAATWVKSVLRPHGGTSDVGIFDQMWTVLPIVYARALSRGARRRLSSA